MMGGVLPGDEKSLKEQIFELHRLREAQDPNGPHWARYQEQITELTERLHQVQAEASVRMARDLELETAKRAVDRARDQAALNEDPWRPMAVAGGVCGAVCLLVWLAWPDLGLLLAVLGVGALSVGVACLSGSMRWRRDGHARVREAERTLAELRRAKDSRS